MRQQIIDELRLVQKTIMEYQKIIDVLYNAPNQQFNFRTKNVLK